MCTTSCIIFGATNLTEEEVEGKTVIEVGACDVNGSLRPILELWKPAKYVGVDIQKGLGVDIVCRAEDLVEIFGREAFDIVISTELLEHVRDWRKVVSAIKNVCKPDGIILITTRSYGFGYHGYPHDFWRYELADMEHIFSDCIIERLERDRLDPGVFIKVKKARGFAEREFKDYELYSIILNERAKEIDEKSFECFQRGYRRRQLFKRMEKQIKVYLSWVRKAAGWTA